MRCAIFGQDDGLERRLRRLIREQGWSLIEAGDGEAQNWRAGIDLAFVLAKDHLDESGVRATRRALPSALILVLGEPSLQARAKALSAGATDFLQHDTSSRYVAVRVAALMRLRRSTAATRITAGELEIDLQHRRGTVNGTELPLSHKEFDLLAMLAARSGHTLPRSELIEGLWQAGAQIEDNTLDVHISRLRRKLRNRCKGRIVTVRGIGYRLCAEEKIAAGQL